MFNLLNENGMNSIIAQRILQHEQTLLNQMVELAELKALAEGENPPPNVDAAVGTMEREIGITKTRIEAASNFELSVGGDQ